MLVDTGTAWRELKGVLFGRMHEDPEIELRAFGAGKRVFVIASAGCTARALAAAGHRVTAVDVNPQQLAYARARSAGATASDGAAERLLSWARRGLALAGWTRERCEQFLAMRDTCAQRAYWRWLLDNPRWRIAMDLALSRAVLVWFYASSLTDSLPPAFGCCVRRRLYRCITTHPNVTNPYLHSLLLGDPLPEPFPARHAIDFHCADAAEYLESCAPASFDAFTLSNVCDGASIAWCARLRTAVRRASAPGAIVILRSFAEPRTPAEERRATLDRSAIWGSIHVSA
jgi:S-adenosylmethionine:diacylglycerol 3-amino-3-carboxypropyl transferase